MDTTSLTPAHWQTDALCRVAKLDLPAVARRMRLSRVDVVDLLGEVLAFQDAQLQARQTPTATPARRRPALQPLRFQRPVKPTVAGVDQAA